MTPQPQQEYIITEEDIQILEDTFGVTLIMPRSRSHTPAPALERQPCKYVAGDFCDNCIDSTCGFYPFDTQHDTAIRKAERERVLDKAIGLIREREINSENPKGWLWRNESLVALLDSLRGEP